MLLKTTKNLKISLIKKKQEKKKKKEGGR